LSADGHPTLCGIVFRGARWRKEWLEPGLSLVYTVNAEFLYWALRLPDYRETLNRGDCTVDGKWVLLALQAKYGKDVAEHLPGSRLTPRLIELASSEGLSIAIIGGTREALDRARSRIKEKWGVIVYTHSPGRIPMDPSQAPGEIEEAARLILEWRPDIVLIALGPPKQELFINMLRPAMERAGTRLAMGIGGTVDMLAGIEKPAPRLVSRLGLEWLWRLAQNPGRRWRKVVRSVRGLACAFGEALSYRVRLRRAS